MASMAVFAKQRFEENKREKLKSKCRHPLSPTKGRNVRRWQIADVRFGDLPFDAPEAVTGQLALHKNSKSETCLLK